MTLVSRNTFSWLVLASSLNVLALLEFAYSFSLSPGITHSICQQNQNFTDTNQIQPPLKSSNMAPKPEPGSDCVIAELNRDKPGPPTAKPCRSLFSSAQGVSPKVVGGDPTEPGEFPSLISIYWYYDTIPINDTYTKPEGWGFKCSGVLISPEYVLSKGICFFKARNEQNYTIIRMYAGKFNHTPGTEPDTEQGPSYITEIIKLPYEPPDVDPKERLRQDFTMVKISPPFTVTETVQPAHWPKADEGLPKGPLTLVGWGSLEKQVGQTLPFEFTPNKKTLNVMDREKCAGILKAYFKYTLSQEEFCLDDLGGTFGPDDGDGPAYSTDAEGKQTFTSYNNFWYFPSNLPPVMNANSFMRAWVESVAGPLP